MNLPGNQSPSERSERLRLGLIQVCLWGLALGLVGYAFYRPAFFARDLRSPSVAMDEQPEASPNTPENVVPYVWRVADFYEPSGPTTYRVKAAPARIVKAGQPLFWRAKSKKHFVQLADRADFLGAREHFEVEGGRLDLGETFAGLNFWRVSHDGRTWSLPASFRVTPEFLLLRARPAKVDQDRVLVDAPRAISSLVEGARDPAFTEISIVEVRAGSRATFRLPSDVRWVRARAIGPGEAVGELSAPVRLR